MRSCQIPRRKKFMTSMESRPLNPEVGLEKEARLVPKEEPANMVHSLTHIPVMVVETADLHLKVLIPAAFPTLSKFLNNSSAEEALLLEDVQSNIQSTG